MPRAKPPVQRTCLACDTEFMGTPESTRCDTCRANGTKVPRDKQLTRAKAAPDLSAASNKPLHELQCWACGEMHMTTRPKAKRCPKCVAENQSTKTSVCLGCGAKYPSFDTDEFHCDDCTKNADSLGIDLNQVREAEIRRRNAEERKARWVEKCERLNKRLEEDERPPRGYPKMKAKDKNTALSKLWVSLCRSDGAASSILMASQSVLTDIDDQMMMLASYHRLRCKGYQPPQIAKLCPVALMAAEDAIDDLPEATEPADEDGTWSDAQEREATAFNLGLTTLHETTENTNQGI